MSYVPGCFISAELSAEEKMICWRMSSISKWNVIERDEEIAKELQDGNKSDD